VGDAAVLLKLLMLCALQGEVANKCIVCPAHKTAFDLATGEPARTTATVNQTCGRTATATRECFRLLGKLQTMTLLAHPTSYLSTATLGIVH
jgi:hypothetical protein